MMKLCKLDDKTMCFMGDTFVWRGMIKTTGAMWDPIKRLWVLPLSAESVNSVMKVLSDRVILADSMKEYISKSRETRMASKDRVEQLVYSRLGFLRDYQKHGVHFLSTTESCLLGDQMGTGKTVQALSTIWVLKETGEISNALVCCPKTLVRTWENELLKFKEYLPGLSYTIVEGSPRERKELWARDTVIKFVNYEALKDLAEVPMSFGIVVADEVSYIKNKGTLRHKSLKRVKSSRRIGLSGTPVENSPEDLYNIMDWIRPSFFGSFYNFRSRYMVMEPIMFYHRVFNKVVGYQHLDELRDRIRPVYLRRTVSDVLKELPPKICQTIEVDMGHEQRKAYEYFKDGAMKELERIGVYKVSASQLAELTFLRRVCDATQLINMSASEAAQMLPTIPDESPKIDALMDLLASTNGSKTVVFSQWADMISLVKDRLSKEGINYRTFIGGQLDRDYQMNEFVSDQHVQVLLCTDSANFGLNLQAASVVVHLDLLWNPARMQQREARVYRQGQQNPVTVYTIITKDSIEARVLKVLGSKQSLFDSTVENQEQDKVFNAEFIKSLLAERDGVS